MSDLFTSPVRSFLLANITSTTLVFPIVNPSRWGVGPYVIQIGTEKIRVTPSGGNNVTVASLADRGIEGTVAASHTAGDPVINVLTPGSVSTMVTGGGAGGGGFGVVTSEIQTAESVASNNVFTDLATPGPSISVVIGPSGIADIQFSAQASNNSGFAGTAVIGVAIDGIDPASTDPLLHSLVAQTSLNVGYDGPISGSFRVTGLTPGAHTFKLRYAERDASNHTFSNRTLSVLPILQGDAQPVSATINTDETQASGASFGDLATAGPSVTVETGTSAVVAIDAGAYKTSGAGNTALLAVEVSGATTIAATLDNGVSQAATGTGTFPLSRTLLISGLNAGVNTFTLKYSNDGGTTWHFIRRSITVWPILGNMAGAGAMAANKITTNEATASASYVDLTTPGPSVLAVIGPAGMAIVTVSAQVINNGGGPGTPVVGLAIDGADPTSTDPRTADFVAWTSLTSGYGGDINGSFLVTGLSPGVHTFKLRYAAGSNVQNTGFSNRSIVVEPIGAPSVTTPLIGSSLRSTQLLDNVPAGVHGPNEDVTEWSATANTAGGKLMIMVGATTSPAFGLGVMQLDLKIDGIQVDATRAFASSMEHLPHNGMFSVELNVPAGQHTFSLSTGPNTSTDANDFANLTLMEGLSGSSLQPVSANIPTGETTASATFVDLATVGPSVTVETGTSVVIAISALAHSVTGGFNGYIAVEVSGATNITADIVNGATGSSANAGFEASLARTFLLTGLNAGVNTFTLKYHTNGGTTWTFYNRDITVWPIPGQQAGAGTAAGGTVVTTESTSSGPFVDLATVGPDVDVVVGPSGIVFLWLAATVRWNSGPASTGFVAVAGVAGANIFPATITNGIFSSQDHTADASVARVLVLTGQNPGITKYRLQYGANNGANYSFYNRTLVAWPQPVVGGSFASGGSVLTQQILDDVAGSSVTGPNPCPNWSASYTSSGGKILVMVGATTWAPSAGVMTLELLVDGTQVDTSRLYENNSGTHLAHHAIFEVDSGVAAGTHTFSLSVGSNTNTDANDFASITIIEVLSGGGAIGADGSVVNTDETTGSTTYVDLTTVGPVVTRMTGTRVVIMESADMYNDGGANLTQLISVEVSGATTIAASDANAALMTSSAADLNQGASRQFVLSGLNPGLNTFTLKYRTTGGTAHFVRRSLTVIGIDAAGGVLTDLFANRPAPTGSHNLFIPQDGHLPSLDVGSSWLPMIGGQVPGAQPPPASNWTAFNSGGQTLLDSNGSLLMTGLNDGGGIVLRGFQQAIGGFTIIEGGMALEGQLPIVGNGSQQVTLGVGMRESGTDKSAAMFVSAVIGGAGDLQPTTIRTAPFSNSSTIGAFVDFLLGETTSSPVFVRVRTDGTNLHFEISRSRNRWFTLRTITIASAFTTAPDQVILATYGVNLIPSGYFHHIKLS